MENSDYSPILRPYKTIANKSNPMADNPSSHSTIPERNQPKVALCLIKKTSIGQFLVTCLYQVTS